MSDIVWLNQRPGLGARFVNRLLRATRSRKPLDVMDDAALIAARTKLDKLDAFTARLRRKSALPFVERALTLADVPVSELAIKQPLPPVDDDVLLFIHGGGFFFRSLHAHRLLAARIAEQAGIRRVILPLYSLAPERIFPIARDECRRVYAAMLTQGIPAERIVVAADSAGAALALGMLLLARDRGLAMPRAVALLSPMVDLSYSGTSIATNADLDPMFGGAPMPVPAYYLGGIDPGNPDCSPLFANLAGLPPFFVQVGSTERLRDDSLRLADSLDGNEHPVTVEVWRDMPHVFQAYDFKEAAQARRHIAAFFRGAHSERPS